jgi:leucyl-tRNA synthetase
VFIGCYAINPANCAKLPIWVADYVLMSYCKGAIMAVPGHDSVITPSRAFDLPVVRVVTGGGDIQEEAWEGDGTMVNSPPLDGLSSAAMRGDNQDERRTASIRMRGHRGRAGGGRD